MKKLIIIWVGLETRFINNDTNEVLATITRDFDGRISRVDGKEFIDFYEAIKYVKAELISNDSNVEFEMI